MKLVIAFLIFTSSTTFAAGSKRVEEPKDHSPQECSSEICPGEQVIFDTSGDSTLVDAEVVQEGDRIMIRNFASGSLEEIRPGNVYSRRQGACTSDGVCVSSRKHFNKAREFSRNGRRHYHPVEVVGVSLDRSRYIIQFFEKSELRCTNSECRGRWDSRASLYLTNPSQCVSSFCVGDTVAVPSRSNQRAKILGVDGDSLFLLDWNDQGNSELNGMGGGWNASDLRIVSRSSQSTEWKHAQELANQGGIDFSRYEAAREAGMNHEDALNESGRPVLVNVERVSTFFRHIAQHVYQFDRSYFEAVSEIGAKIRQKTMAENLYRQAAIELFRSLAYPSLGKSVKDALEKLENAQSHSGIRDIVQIESTVESRRVALELLVASLRTGTSLQSAEQTAQAARFIEVMGRALASPTRAKDLAELLQLIPSIREFNATRALNPYLRARTVVDTALLSFLENT